MLAKALGVQNLIVAVTKMNSVNWSEERFKLIREQVTPFLEGSCGFHNIPFIPIDSIANVNIHRKYEESWYKGPYLLEYLNQIQIPERKPMGPLRIPLIDKYK